MGRLENGSNASSKTMAVASNDLESITPARLLNGAATRWCNHVAVHRSLRADPCIPLQRGTIVATEAGGTPRRTASRLRSIARALGAEEDEAGRLLVKPSMEKELKRALKDDKRQLKSVSSQHQLDEDVESRSKLAKGNKCKSTARRSAGTGIGSVSRSLITSALG